MTKGMEIISCLRVPLEAHLKENSLSPLRCLVPNDGETLEGKHHATEATMNNTSSHDM